MKRKRHLLIISLISEHHISTQEELLSYLSENGVDVTQATVSRDIKELKLIKTPDSSGGYYYVVSDDIRENSKNNRNSLLSSSIIDVKSAGNMVCVLCNPGSAQAVCFSIDEIKSEIIIGTIAGDDTIFVMCSNQHDANEACKMIKCLAEMG